jgi:hypothetical protein
LCAAISREGTRPAGGSRNREVIAPQNISGAFRMIDSSMKSARRHNGFDVAAQYSFGN